MGVNKWLVHNILLHTKINLHVMRSPMSFLYAPGPIRVIQTSHVGLEVKTVMRRRGRDLIIPDAESIGHAQLIDTNWKQHKFKIHTRGPSKGCRRYIAQLASAAESDTLLPSYENRKHLTQPQCFVQVLCKYDGRGLVKWHQSRAKLKCLLIGWSCKSLPSKLQFLPSYVRRENFSKWPF